MALIHDADLRPDKLELLAGWLPLQAWYPGEETPELTKVGSYRFDDPDGEVGLEALVVSDQDGVLVHVPLVYRGEPTAEGGVASLITTMEHSVLGTRYVYDATGDPVYARALATAILHGPAQAGQVAAASGQTIEPTMTVRGEGSLADRSREEIDALLDDLDVESAEIAGEATVVDAGAFTLTVQHLLDVVSDADLSAGQARLLGTWPGREEPAVLATLA